MSAARKQANCDRSLGAELLEREWASTSDLHYRLGKLIEDRPGVLFTDQHKFNTNERALDGLALERAVNMDCTRRLETWAQDHLASLSPERRAQLNAEWDEPAEAQRHARKGVK